MTKKELVREIHKIYPHIPQWELSVAVNCIFEEIEKALLKDELVSVRGFGRWKRKLYPARKLISKFYNVDRLVPEQAKVRFEASRSFLRRINNGGYVADESRDGTGEEGDKR